jgi:hypothetical protein
MTHDIFITKKNLMFRKMDHTKLMNRLHYVSKMQNLSMLKQMVCRTIAVM